MKRREGRQTCNFSAFSRGVERATCLVGLAQMYNKITDYCLVIYAPPNHVKENNIALQNNIYIYTDLEDLVSVTKGIFN